MARDNATCFSTNCWLSGIFWLAAAWEIARLAGELQNRWRKKGHTLSLPDVTIAAVALTHGLTLLTDNRKDFPMPELALYSLP